MGGLSARALPGRFAAGLLGHEGELIFADGDLDPESGVHRAQCVGVADGLEDFPVGEVCDVAV
jgi:hypothetical protein